MSSTGVRQSAMAAETDSLIRHLAHELRQPLSGIESIAYYIDMVMGQTEPEVRSHCARLRGMVQHAHWMLEDALLAAALPCECGPVEMGRLLRRLGAELALHEDRDLELILLHPDVPVEVPVNCAQKFCQHILAFFRDVGRAQDPIHFRTDWAGDAVFLTISAEMEADTADLVTAVQPVEPGGGIRAFVHAADGRMAVIAQERRLTLRFEFAASK